MRKSVIYASIYYIDAYMVTRSITSIFKYKSISMMKIAT